MSLLDEINKLVPEDMKVKIKALAVKFNAVPAPTTAPPAGNPAPANLAAVETKLKDGSTLSVDKMEIGGIATLITEAGSSPAPDGSYEAEDGTVITVTSGAISDIEKPEPAPTPENEMPAVLARLTALEAKLSASEKENLTLKANLAALSESNKTTLSAMNLMLSAPAGDPIEVSKPKPKRDLSKIPYDEMTNFEKTLFNRGEY